MSKTLFEKIISREIPAAIVYEDDLVVAFRDIRPQAPTHVLIVPRKPIPRMARSEEHTSELQSLRHLVFRLLVEKKNRTLWCTEGGACAYVRPWSSLYVGD